MATSAKYKTKEYLAWSRMISRCRHNIDYRSRGITVCKRWEVFENFLNDMGRVPPNKTLDRIKNNKGYTPSNCRWASSSEQMFNRRGWKWYSFKEKLEREIKVLDYMATPVKKLKALVQLREFCIKESDKFKIKFLELYDSLDGSYKQLHDEKLSKLIKRINNGKKGTKTIKRKK
jgi:hypothetical protein